MGSNMLLHKLCCAVLFVILGASGQLEQPLSPCPKVFTYENDGQQWYGMAKVPTPLYGSEIRLQVYLSIGAKLPTNYTGSLELIGERGRILLNILKGLPISYKVNFPLLNPITRVTKISVNDMIICTGPAETYHDGIKFITSIALNHVLQTGERPEVPLKNPEYEMNHDSIPNPENFAQPRPPKSTETPPSPDQDKQSAPEQDTNQINEVNDGLISWQQKPASKPQQKPTDDNLEESSQRPYPVVYPTPPVFKPQPHPRPPKPVDDSSEDSFHKPYPSSGFATPPQQTVVHHNGVAQPVFNYQVTQDRNISKSETSIQAPHNPSNPGQTYQFYEVNKTETVVNRFSYEWQNVPYGAHVTIPQQQNWKESHGQPDAMSYQNNRKSRRSKRGLKFHKT